MKKVVLSLGVFIIYFSVFSQDSEYRVFYFSGKPKIVEKNKEIEIKRDIYLSPKSILKIPENSYVVLVNKKEVPVGISNPGNYSVEDLNKIYKNVGSSNLTEEFFEYIAKNMIDENQKTRKSGGVYRAVGDILKNPFDEAVLIGDEISFEWNNPRQKYYYFKVYDTESWELKLNYRTNDSIYLLKYDPALYKKGTVYAWTVYHDIDHPQQGTVLRTFTFADDATLEKCNKTIAEYKQKYSPDYAKIEIIRFFIDNNFYPMYK